MPAVEGKPEEIPQLLQFNVDFLKCRAFFSRRQVVRFNDHLQQVAQVVLKPVSQGEFLAAGKSLNDWKGVFKQVVCPGYNGFFCIFHENVSSTLR